MKPIICYIFFIKLCLASEDLCNNLQCENENEVCGMKSEGEGFRLKLFRSECDLVKFECREESDSAYGVISLDYCHEAFKTEPNSPIEDIATKEPCTEQNCSQQDDDEAICAIKKDGEGFRIRIFENKCKMKLFNCENEIDFAVVDLNICNGMQLPQDVVSDDNPAENDVIEDSSNTLPSVDDTNVNLSNITEIDDPIDDEPAMGGINIKPKTRNIVVVRVPSIDFAHINETIDNFFAATHVFDLPVREMDRRLLNVTTRRRLIRIAKPVKVFVPWISIPKNVSDDFDHEPTLASCYHKCPTKCPDTYSPVCGVPGQVAREPSLMFQNHCFMDVAQCKMYREDKSITSQSSAYVESSFLFCLGDEMNGMYRFLPLIRTLQHMGRLKKKGHFRYKFKNMRFFNNVLSRQPKFMG